jgi:glycosyltransferase involved in cell wall biosynthesis
MSALRQRDEIRSPAASADSDLEQRICVVGPGARFLSGISHHTTRVANSLAGSNRVAVVLMRQLLPTFLYPGRARVGADLTQVSFAAEVETFDGVDWFWLPSILRAIAFLVRRRPHVLVLQWWTGTVLHSYLVLALLTRALGGRVVIEFHEVLDTAELRLAWIRAYVNSIAPFLMRLASGFVIHSEHDLPALQQRYRIAGRPVEVIPPGSLIPPAPQGATSGTSSLTGAVRAAPASCCNLLFFGVIRPFKGLEDLIQAFDGMPDQDIAGFWLTVVGETWEGWTIPEALMKRSRHRDRITFLNRYVHDREVDRIFSDADAVVLPYHRSSASGPLHIAMSHGLPLVVTAVGGLPEAVRDYAGATLVPPRDPEALRAALHQMANLKGRRYSDPHSWEQKAQRYQALIDVVRQRA